MPTIALSNSIAFGQMTDPAKTVSVDSGVWHCRLDLSGVLISSLGLDTSALTFKMAAIASLTLGIVSFALPNTPPKGKGSESALGTEALVLFKDKSYLIFFIAAILICIPLSFYYGFANVFFND